MHKINVKKITSREIFELIEDLCKEYGTKEVKTTVMSCFDLIEENQKRREKNDRMSSF